MLLGFKRQFAPYVEDRSKTHTIRAVRKIRPRVGETCHCYVDPRQTTMRLLGRFPCVRVERITITFGYGGIIDRIIIGGESLEVSEMREFAWRDGFRNTDDPLAEMCGFWQREHQARPTYIWSGDLIHWQG